MPGVFMKSDADGHAALRPRPIFRADAVRRYVQDQQKTVLPRFVCSRAFLYLWMLLGFLLLAGIFASWHLGVLLAGQFRGVYR
jgi:hypothetical protein